MKFIAFAFRAAFLESLAVGGILWAVWSTSGDHSSRSMSYAYTSRPLVDVEQHFGAMTKRKTDWQSVPQNSQYESRHRPPRGGSQPIVSLPSNRLVPDARAKYVQKKLQHGADQFKDLLERELNRMVREFF